MQKYRGGALLIDQHTVSWMQKILTYAVSGIFLNIDPPPPLPLVSVSSPRTKGGGYTHSPGGEGVDGQYFGRCQTLDWPLTV
jgi:hypothetical protein